MPRAEPFDDLVGVRLGPYKLLRELGHGATASVYEAVHDVLGKTVAIKVLHAHVAANAVTVARFEREGRAAARVRHSNVVDVHDVVLDARRPFLVLELVEGPTLGAVLRDAPLDARRAMELIVPVCAAVACAHDAGIIHRDLKPGNIIVAHDRDGAWMPKVADFGISKLVDLVDERQLTRDDGLLGTLSYSAPEQVRAPESVDDAADQYAIGVILFEALTGRRPFEASTSWALMQAIVRGGAEPPSRLVRTVPEALDAVVIRTLARDPSDRFPDVRALGEALLPFASGATQAKYAAELSPSSSSSAGAADGAMVRALAMPARGSLRWRAALLLAASLVVAFAVHRATVRVPTASVAHPQPADPTPPVVEPPAPAAAPTSTGASTAAASATRVEAAPRDPTPSARPDVARTAPRVPPVPASPLSAASPPPAPTALIAPTAKAAPAAPTAKAPTDMGDNEAPILQ